MHLERTALICGLLRHSLGLVAANSIFGDDLDTRSLEEPHKSHERSVRHGPGSGFDNQRLARRVKDDGAISPDLMKHIEGQIKGIANAYDAPGIERLLKETEEKIQEWESFPSVHRQALKGGGVSNFDLRTYHNDFSHRQSVLKLQAQDLRKRNRLQEATRVEKALHDLNTAYDEFFKVVETSNKERTRLRTEWRARLTKQGTRPPSSDASGSGTNAGDEGKTGRNSPHSHTRAGGTTNKKHLRRELGNKEFVRRTTGAHDLAPELDKQVRALFAGGQPEVEPFLRETHEKCQEVKSFAESHAGNIRPGYVLNQYMVDIHHRHRVLEMLADRLGPLDGYREERQSILQALEELKSTHRELRQAKARDKTSSGGKAGGGRTSAKSRDKGLKRKAV